MRRLVAVTGIGICLAIAWLAWQSAWLRQVRQGPRSVLLISIDTLRADRLGSYGYAAAATPVLDGLARRGLRFAQATTTAPLTLPAHTSLLTGTFPAFHGVRDNGSFYAEDDADHARRNAAGTRLPHGRIRRGVRARPALGARAGLRSLLR